MIFFNVDKAEYVLFVLEFINIIKFFKGPYFFASLTNYDNNKSVLKSPFKFYYYYVPPLYLHNINPIFIGIITYLIKPIFGSIWLSVNKKFTKEKFDPKGKCSKSCMKWKIEFEYGFIHLLNTSYLLIATFAFLQLYDLLNYDW